MESCVVVVVGHDEESVALVRRASIGRSVSTPFCIEPERGKVGKDDFEAVRAERGDVFNDDQSRLNFGDNSEVLLPEPASFTTDARLPACNADVLAGESASDALHHAAKWASVEGGHIRPNRRWSHVAFFHARSQDFAGVGFPLHENNDSAADARKLNSHVESCGSAE